MRAGPVAIVLVALVAGCGDDGDGAATLVIEGVAFPGEPLEIDPGQTVEIENRDQVAHTVTSDVGGFDIDVDADNTTEFTAPPDPADYPVVCRIHPTMSMTIRVVG